MADMNGIAIHQTGKTLHAKHGVDLSKIGYMSISDVRYSEWSAVHDRINQATLAQQRTQGTFTLGGGVVGTGTSQYPSNAAAQAASMAAAGMELSASPTPARTQTR